MDQRFAHLKVYNGKEPYIFVSYAHKDSDRVLPAIEALQHAGYRIWFDLGIEAGTEWSNNIAAHLRDCATFIVFVTANSMASENCLDEIAYAKNHQKPSLMIFLEENVTLPEGIDMQTARFQRLYMNRHQSVDTFVTKFHEATMFAACRGPVGTTEAPAAPAPAPAPTPAPVPVPTAKKAVSPVVWIGIAAGAVVLALVVVIGVLLAGGADSDTPDDKPQGGVSTPADEEDTGNTEDPEEEKPIVMSDDLADFTFTLEGVVYQLPFAYDKLTENGWTIGGSGVNEDTLMAGKSSGEIRFYNNGKSVYFELYNDSGNAAPVKDCLVGGLQVQGGASMPDFQMAGGLNPQSTVAAIETALGVPNDRSDYDDRSTLYYYVGSDDAVGAHFVSYFAEDDADWSYVELSNIVYSSVDPAETNEAEPEYLSEYTSPTSLGTELTSGNVEIEGDVYAFPTTVKAFLENGWKISQKPACVVSGDSAEITLSRDGKNVTVKVQNFAEYQTIADNCVVMRVSVYATDDVSITLPGGISHGMTMTDAVATTLTQAGFDVSEGTYSTTYSCYNDDDLYIYVSVDNETNTIQTVTVSRS